MQKSLEKKLKRLQSDPSCRDFILADAKDADMAFGLASPGIDRKAADGQPRYRSLKQYRQLMRDVTHQGLVDIMLMSASSNEILTIEERLFEGSAVTPAIRANDTTDIWAVAGGQYVWQPSRPFRTASIAHVQSGKLKGQQWERKKGANLGLYSMTFNNDIERDLQTLEAYKQFRLESEPTGFQHFLEVFAPNACESLNAEEMAPFVNDCIARALAGVTKCNRPVFLKVHYFGPAAMEALVHYDPSLIVGIMGGSAGTTHDAFHMLWEAKKYGARVALYGRKINNADDQLTFVKYLRLLSDDEIEPAEAVRAYHADLQRVNIRSQRSLEEDMQLTQVTAA